MTAIRVFLVMILLGEASSLPCGAYLIDFRACSKLGYTF